MIPGMAEVSPAITAPAPTEINRAGSAQQTSVEALVNNARVGATLSCQVPRIMVPRVYLHGGGLARCGSPPVWPKYRSFRRLVTGQL